MKLKIVVLVILMLVVGGIVYAVFFRDSDRGQTPLRADAKDLEGTIVTPHLHQKMLPNKNILWCSTFQLSWNELNSLAKGHVTLDPNTSITEILNNSPISKSDIDSTAYVAKAGFVEDGIVDQIKAELNKKFQGQAQSELLEVGSQLGGLIAYANLNTFLPFRYPFYRFNRNGLSFVGEPVQNFGLPDNGPQRSIRDSYISAQVTVVDVKNEDDFIIELENTAPRNRLILAKVPPSSTLQETIKMVQSRRTMTGHNDSVGIIGLHIPVIDFDLLKHYRELEGRTIRSSDKRVNGQPLTMAAQSIQFRLDELGAVLKSEAMNAAYLGGMPKRPIKLLFDKPFLILIQREDAKNPFFALWVGNSELLFPVK